MAGLGMLSVPLIAFAQEREKKEREEKSSEEKEEKKEEAEEKKEEVKDKAEDAVDDRDEVVDGPGTENSQDGGRITARCRQVTTRPFLVGRRGVHISGLL